MVPVPGSLSQVTADAEVAPRKSRTDKRSTLERRDLASQVPSRVAIVRIVISIDYNLRFIACYTDPPTPSGDTLFNIGTFSQIHIPVTPPPLLRSGSVTSSRTSQVDTVRAIDEVQGQRRLQGADRDGDLHGNGKRLPIAGVCVIDRAAARRYRDGERLQRGVGVACAVNLYAVRSYHGLAKHHVVSRDTVGALRVIHRYSDIYARAATGRIERRGMGTRGEIVDADDSRTAAHRVYRGRRRPLFAADLTHILCTHRHHIAQVGQRKGGARVAAVGVTDERVERKILIDGNERAVTQCPAFQHPVNRPYNDLTKNRIHPLFSYLN